MTTQTHRHEVTPQAFLQLAGHALRWQLLRELAHSDRMVNELSELIGEPQNLVSYHLGKLRDGRLVTARQSAADRRDTYYTADLTRIGKLLSGTAGALHPGIRLVPAAGEEARNGRTVRVLFLCTGNSARSQMAEALARSRSNGTIRSYSGGSQPKAMHPNAVRVMREEHGLDLSGLATKHFNVFAGKKFDWVISLCDRVREVCPPFPGSPQTVHWSMANPATGEADDITYPLFQQTAAELATRIDFLLAALSNQAPVTPRKKEKTHERANRNGQRPLHGGRRR
jgi:protein-tyrosine-phosphatase